MNHMQLLDFQHKYRENIRLGTSLRTMRREFKLTLGQVAQLTGLSLTQMSEIERGEADIEFIRDNYQLVAVSIVRLGMEEKDAH